jgi:DNA-binding NarL/FixJ family response regulator
MTKIVIIKSYDLRERSCAVMIKVVIIDGQERYRNGMRMLLSSQDDFEVSAEGQDGYEAIKLVDSLKPDILVIDINLHSINGARIISLLKCRSPHTAIIILTALDGEEYILDAICNGASGYLLKRPEMDNIVEKIRLIYGGGSFMAPEITAKVFRMFSDLVKNQYKLPGIYPPQEEARPLPSNISRIEFRILGFVGQGLSNREIAQRLCLREGTIRNYISTLLQKTALRDRTQIAIFAINNGLLIEEEASGPCLFA